MTVPGSVPFLRVRPAQFTQLNDSLALIEVDDRELADPAYQEVILAEVQEAADAAFGDLAQDACERMAEPPWFLIIRGLPISRATPLLVAVSATLGALVEPYRQSWSQVVRHIVPSRDRTVDGRVLNEFLHTDGTDWVRPNDYTCLFCMRPDQSRDGESLLLDVATLLDEMTAAPDAGVVHRLASQAVPWRIAEELGGGVHWQCPIDLAVPHIRWLRYTVTLSEEEGLASLPTDTADDLLTFEQAVTNCRGVARTRLQAGDLLLLDNGRSLHARTKIRDAAGSTRELLRTKVMRREAA
jgi:alpha-ketoglutarate-dependent taurine dioxygenase